jgi:7-carboxy-7-deazaguanine synthase
MKICEIFGNTIQGEAIYSGHPAIFIRTTGCVPPYCDFCDTKYSWTEGKNMTIEQIIKKIKKYKQRLVIITGAEPAIQPDINDLIISLHNNNYSVQIETSGKAEIHFPSYATVVCSPKQYNGNFIITETAIQKSDYFKFVVGNKKEMKSVIGFLNDNPEIHRTRVYIMPKGATREEQIKLMPQIVKWCCEYDLKLSARLHVLIWDKRRGV